MSFFGEKAMQGEKKPSPPVEGVDEKLVTAQIIHSMWITLGIKVNLPELSTCG
ncbi:hypothetical protein HM1_0906 [Heliomicrobium modesticaldum Ice1]|uniref:Uncharacterized protein n=1 Tax=Heliobacterium modesticaldum (strain ATCC 51547 / Ice1) TaxID=498761 RepID=B0TAK7_HELMI|nr:hypothetical protein HM1_0906 [Heliomicrobium modesticaldum Ice1]